MRKKFAVVKSIIENRILMKSNIVRVDVPTVLQFVEHFNLNAIIKTIDSTARLGYSAGNHKPGIIL